MMKTDLVIVELRGGDVSESVDAVCVDCQAGGVSSRYDWAALVRRDRVAALLARTGAEQVGSPELWDGGPFGDGNGGTVARGDDGVVRGGGLNEEALFAGDWRARRRRAP